MKVREPLSSSPLTTPRSFTQWHACLWGSLLALLVVAVYWPTLSAGFIWDDDAYVGLNPTLRSLDGLANIWFKLRAVPQYYPLIYTTFWVEFHLWDSTLVVTTP